MTEMVEQVARALREYCASIEVESAGEVTPDLMVNSNEIARVAIAAMREPTKLMRVCGRQDWANNDRDERARLTWQAMIDAALTSTESVASLKQ